MFCDLVSGVTARHSCVSMGWCSVNKGMAGGPITEWISEMRYEADKTALNSGLPTWMDKINKI